MQQTEGNTSESDKYNYYLKQLQFEKNPMGGHYKLLDSSNHKRQFSNESQNHKGDRLVYSTVYSIYKKGEFFPLHSLTLQDEIFFHIDGGCLKIVEFDKKTKRVAHYKLGKKLHEGEILNFNIREDTVTALYCEDEYVLIGVMCSPEWHFDDSIIYDQTKMLELFPEEKDLIEKYVYKKKEE